MDWIISVVVFGLLFLAGLYFVFRSTVNFYLAQKSTHTRRMFRKDIEKIWQNKEEKAGKKH